MRPLPIRQRLTLWYFVMFATAAVLLTFTSWWMLRRTLDATLHQDLQERTDDVRKQLHQLGPEAAPADTQRQFDATYRYRDDGKWLQLLDQDGRWVYRSARMASSGQKLPLPHALPRTGVVSEFIQSKHKVRAFSVPVTVDGRSYSVQTGIAMNKSDVLLHDYGLGLLLLTPIVLFAAAAGGHFMSRKALGPVDAIAHEARRITDRNLDTRLPVSPAEDELSYLSQTLNHMLARIDGSFRSVREFTANASHELRTPLARIRTETEIALFRPREAAEYRQALEHVHQDAIDMSNLITSLLTLARAEACTDALRMMPVDLSGLMESIAEEWKPIVERLGLRLDMALPPAEKGRLVVMGDRLGLLRLLRIWLDNACKYTPAGGAIAIVAALQSDSVLLAIEDTGIGIAPDHHGRIFDRFYRVNGDTGTQKAGAGLGLSLAVWIAEQHKTRITLDSAIGSGSRFQIRLARVLHEAPAARHAIPHRANEPELSPFKIHSSQIKS